MAIEINPENKGKFTETMKRTGKSAEELSHSKNKLTRKRAQFAINSKKWKHKDGGLIRKANEGMLVEDPEEKDFRAFVIGKVHGNEQGVKRAQAMYQARRAQGATEQQAAADVVAAGFETGGTYNANLGTTYKGLFQWDKNRINKYGNTFNSQIKGIGNTIRNRKEWSNQNDYNTYFTERPDSTVRDITKALVKGFIIGGNAESRANAAQKYFGMTENK